MDEVERQLEELDEEERKRETERSRQKIHKAFAPRPAHQMVRTRFLRALPFLPCTHTLDHALLRMHACSL